MQTKLQRKQQNKQIARRNALRKHRNIKNNNMTIWQRQGLL